MAVDRQMIARTVTFGEGPYLQACAQDRAVAVEDLATAPAWVRLNAVAGELVQTRVELAARELEVAQLRQALTSRVWVEQAKGVLAATQGSDPEAAFQQLCIRARASSRKLAEVAQEVVQDAQRQRLAALTLDDARVQQAEGRAKAAEQALEATQTGLARRQAALDQAQDAADERERAADDRDRIADDRDRTAGHPDRP